MVQLGQLLLVGSDGLLLFAQLLLELLLFGFEFRLEFVSGFGQLLLFFGKFL